MAEARAVLRFVRVAPRKARPVIDMIRGQEVPMALVTDGLLSRCTRASVRTSPGPLTQSVISSANPAWERPSGRRAAVSIAAMTSVEVR